MFIFRIYGKSLCLEILASLVNEKTVQSGRYGREFQAAHSCGDALCVKIKHIRRLTSDENLAESIHRSRLEPTMEEDAEMSNAVQL